MPFNAPSKEDFSYSPPGFGTHPSLGQPYQRFPKDMASTPPYTSLTTFSAPGLSFYSTADCPGGAAVIFTNGNSFRNLYRRETNDQNQTRHVHQARFSAREEDIRFGLPLRRVVALKALSAAAVAELCLSDHTHRREAIIMYATATRAYSHPCHCCSTNPNKIFPQCVAMPDLGQNIDEKCLNCHYLNCHCVWDDKDPGTPPSMRGALSQQHTFQLLTSPYMTSRLDVLTRTWAGLVASADFQDLSRRLSSRDYNNLQEFQVALLGLINLTHMANVSPTAVAELPTFPQIPLTVMSIGEYGPDLSSRNFPPANMRELIATASRTKSIQTYPASLVPAAAGSPISSSAGSSPATSRRGTVSGGTPPSGVSGFRGGLPRSPSGGIPRSSSGGLPRSPSGGVTQSPLSQEVPAPSTPRGSESVPGSSQGGDASSGRGGRGGRRGRRGRRG
jgi:hypothetical protein